MTENDDKFYDMADEHIRLCNQQLAKSSKGEVSASMMYSLTRFNAWISAAGWKNAKEMEEAKEETIEYFVGEYRKKIKDSLEDYIKNFDHLMNTK